MDPYFLSLMLDHNRYELARARGVRDWRAIFARAR